MPAGVADEYIQLTNITGQSIIVSAADGSSGWALVAINSGGSTSTKLVIPNGTIIPQGAHYLAANSAYSLTANDVFGELPRTLADVLDKRADGGLPDDLMDLMQSWVDNTPPGRFDESYYARQMGDKIKQLEPGEENVSES